MTSKVYDLNIQLRTMAGRKYKRYWELSEGYDYAENREAVMEFYRAFFLFVETSCRNIREDNPKEVWITIQNSSSLFAALFTSRLKDYIPGAKIRIGGPQARVIEQDTIHKNGVPWQNMFHEADDLYTEEGELLLLPQLGETYVKDLNKIPFADFTVLNRRSYYYPRGLPIWMTRGCPNRCIFCSERELLGGKFRWRSGDRTFEELFYQKINHPDVYFFQFRDSMTNGNMKELERFCDLMIHYGMNKKVRWNMPSIGFIKGMMELYPKIKEAGCNHIAYGLESPVPRLLKSIGKGTSKGLDFSAEVKAAANSGLKVALNFMFGLPGETEEDFEEMMAFLQENHKYIYMVNPSVLLCGFFPGSSGWRNPEKYWIELGSSPVDWSADNGENTYEVRKNRFMRFVTEARRLGVRNLFGNISEPTACIPKPLYYTEGQLRNFEIDLDTNLLWHLNRLKSIWWWAVKNDFKDRLRKWYYMRG
jgi:hypothetical protein